MAGIDSDYAWLKTHLDRVGQMDSRTELVSKVTGNLLRRARNGQLPFTLGVFGGWGTGKTTFLAMLADELERKSKSKIVYFNSWKYAGFMEIVPALIYKILQYGLTGTEATRSEAARRVVLALGKKYSDQVGEWAQKKIGVNPTELFKDLYSLPDTLDDPQGAPAAVHAYYTQVDKAQDELRKILGTVTPGSPSKNTVIVLLDELDRCDPDEAFNVIKQMRVLFGMRDLPVAFVVCANPEPIGLAIKHRYGLESEAGDYEARRILEKFVDSYEDLSAAEALGTLVQTIWKDEALPWIMSVDEANVKPAFYEQVVMNATAFDAITTSVPLFANLRVLHKSFEYIRENVQVNRHLLWTHWFLEMATQIDPRFRREIRMLAGPIEHIVLGTYGALHGITFRANKSGQKISIEYETDKGKTLFAVFRSFFWEQARKELKLLQDSSDPEDAVKARALATLVSEPLKVDVIVLLSMLPFETLPDYEKLCKSANSARLPDFKAELQWLVFQFSNVLAS